MLRRAWVYLLAGAAVVFFLPSSGPSGSFVDGSKTLTVSADAQGRAVAAGIHRNNLSGQMQIRVTASYGGQTVSAVITQTNVAGGVGGLSTTAKVLIVSLELCTLHLQEIDNVERLLSFLLFGDGCAAALVSAEPAGLALDAFHAELVPAAADQITWTVGDMGFDMFLSGKIPTTIAGALRGASARVLAGAPAEAFGMWAVHPGGRTVLDAVEDALSLGQGALAP